MKLESESTFLELIKVEIIPLNLPCPGDTRLQVALRIHDFSGAATCWVAAPSLHEFRNAVAALFEKFDGDAVLESLSPDEFYLALAPANPRGYVNVKVQLRRQFPECCVSGSFEVPLQEISAIADWVDSSEK